MDLHQNTAVVAGTATAAALLLGTLASRYLESRGWTHGHVKGRPVSEPFSAHWFPGRAHKVLLPFGETQYYLDGPVDGPRVVLVHGMTPPAIVYKPLADALVKKGYRVLSYDLYGRGYSDAPDVKYNEALYVSQLSSLLLAVGWSRVTLVGYSLGGAIATAYTSLFPNTVEKLVLAAPAGLMRALPSVSIAVHLIQTPVIGDLVFYLFASPVIAKASQTVFKSVDQPVVRQVIQVALDQITNRPEHARAYLSTTRNFPFSSLHSAYERVGKHPEIPVFVIWGDVDTVVPFENWTTLKECVPHAQLHEMTSHGHGMLLESLGDYFPQLYAFISAGEKSVLAGTAGTAAA